MYRISACLLIAFNTLVSVPALAHNEDVCDAIAAIVSDAPNKFRNIRGKMIENSANATMWTSGIKVPGTAGDRFVESMGLFYEGVFFQTRTKDELGPEYKKVKDMLTECLAGEGYKTTQQPNFTPGMEVYKKIAFMPAVATGTATKAAPPHLTLEVIYSKVLNQYTIVMYIFEH